MSLFSKVLFRAAGPSTPTVPSARPKGLGGLLYRHEINEEEIEPLRRQEEEEDAQPLRREPMEEEELQALRSQEVPEEEMQTLRRQEEEEEEMQPLRRQEEEEEETQPLRREPMEEEELQSLRRQEVPEEEEMQPLRRQEEEEQAMQTLRRQEEAEEEVQPLRRQPEEEEEKSDMQALCRMADPASEELPETQIDNPEFMDEPSAAQALRRSDAPGVGVGEGAAPGQAATEPFFPALDTEPGLTIASLPPAVPLSEQPRVHIDQIDVTIHEPTPASGGTAKDAGAELSRLLSGRYLRGI